MFRPVSAMISLASLRLTPGISASRYAAGSTAASGCPGVRAGVAVAVTPQAAGMASTRLDPVLDLGGPPVQQRDVVHQRRRITTGWGSPRACPPVPARSRHCRP